MVIVQIGTQQVGFVVDNLIGQEEVVIKPLDNLLQGTPAWPAPPLPAMAASPSSWTCPACSRLMPAATERLAQGVKRITMAVKVLVVDDSSFFRRRVSEIINQDP